MGDEKSKEPLIIDVWASNLDVELKRLSELVEDYPYIGMVGFCNIVFISNILGARFCYWVVSISSCVIFGCVVVRKVIALHS